jgi:hypothetical protein
VARGQAPSVSRASRLARQAVDRPAG